MLRKCASHVLSFLIVAILLVNLLIKLFLWIFRDFVVGLYLRRKYGCPVEFLTSKDAAFALDTEKNRMHGNICIVVKGKADVSRLQNRIDTIWMRAKNGDGRLTYWKFTQQLRCEFGYLFWMPENDFRVENHVFHRNDLELKNDSEMHRFLAEIFDRPFQKALSPWAITLVDLADDYPGLESGQHHLVCIANHHGLSDGVSTLRLHYLHLYDQLTAEKIIPIANQPKRTSVSMILKQVVNAVANAPSVIFYNWFIKRDDKHILRGKTLTGIKLFGFSKPMSLNRVKKVRNATKTTVNDVLMSCIAGALRSHFLKEGQIPKAMSQILPVSMHDWKREPRFENNTALIFFSGASDESTPRARLLTTKINMNAVKDTKQANVFQLFVASASNVYPRCVTDVLARSFKSTCCISNVFGPTETRYISGNEVVRIGFFVPSPPNVGLGISIFSYKNDIQFGLKVDSALIEKQEIIDELLHDILRELEALEKDC